MANGQDGSEPRQLNGSRTLTTIELLDRYKEGGDDTAMASFWSVQFRPSGAGPGGGRSGPGAWPKPTT